MTAANPLTKAAGTRYVLYGMGRTSIKTVAGRDLVAGELYNFGGILGQVTEDALTGEVVELEFNICTRVKLNGLSSVPRHGQALWFKPADQTFHATKPTSKPEEYLVAGYFYVGSDQPTPTSHENLEGFLYLLNTFTPEFKCDEQKYPADLRALRV